jgi:protein-arginine kinase activator protein McsA
MAKLKDNPMVDYMERNACEICGRLAPTELMEIKTENGMEKANVCDTCREDIEYANNLEENIAIYKYGTKEEIKFLLEITADPLLAAIRKNREEVFKKLGLTSNEINQLNLKFPNAWDLYKYISQTYKDKLINVKFEPPTPAWKMELEPAPKGTGKV